MKRKNPLRRVFLLSNHQAWWLRNSFPCRKYLIYQHIGLVSGYSYGNLLQTLAKHQIEPDYANSPYQNLHKLFSGRIQANIMTEAVAQRVLQRFKPQQQAQIRRAEQPILYNQLHLLFPKNHPQSAPLLKRFNQAIKNQPFSMPNNHWRTSISQKNHKEILGCNKNFTMSCYALRFETQE